jgi:hypothetical protein
MSHRLADKREAPAFRLDCRRTSAGTTQLASSANLPRETRTRRIESVIAVTTRLEEPLLTSMPFVSGRNCADAGTANTSNIATSSRRIMRVS